MPIISTYPTLKSATPIEGHNLILHFEGNEKRIYNFKPHLTHKFYSPLTDENLFKKVSVNDGEIEWLTGQDFCPHTLYEESRPIK